jgi:O-antigen/teichoic acid export membrane protein
LATDLSPEDSRPIAPESDQPLPDGGERAIRGGAIRVAGYLMGVVVSLAGATILVRHLGIVGFGRYATVTSLIAIVGGISEAGISLYGIREFAARPDRERRLLMANLLGLRLALTLLGVTCAIGFAIAVGYREALVLGTVLVGAGLLVQVAADVMSIPLQAQLRLGRMTAADLSRRLTAVLLVGALALAGAGLVPLLAVSLGSGLAALALLVRMVRGSLALRAGWDRRAWRRLLVDTLPSAIATSIGAIYFYVTIIVMSLVASASQTGLFATSFRVTQVALGIPILLLTAIFPMMSRQGADWSSSAGEIVGKVFRVAAICGLWMSLTMLLGASFIMTLVAGHQGSGAVSVLRIQGAVLTVSFISASSALTLISMRRFRSMISISASALALNIVLDLVLIGPLGARGAALADVIAETIAAIGLTAIVIRAVPQHRITASAAPPLVLAAALSASVLLLPIGSIGRVVCATIIYFGVLTLTRSIPGELITAVRRARISSAVR